MLMRGELGRSESATRESKLERYGRAGRGDGKWYQNAKRGPPGPSRPCWELGTCGDSVKAEGRVFD